MVHRVSYTLAGQELILETGRLAKQANGSVYAQFGGSAVIATACASSEAREGLDFVPVTVDYNEKYYAAGKIPGGFIKREGRPKDKEILVSRLIDRPMRPLFEVAFGREIQIVPTCISSDQVNPPDILAVIASSAAVVISDIPVFKEIYKDFPVTYFECENPQNLADKIIEALQKPSPGNLPDIYSFERTSDIIIKSIKNGVSK